MDSLTALHTAARRYCMDNAKQWRQHYSAQRAERGTIWNEVYEMEADATFPRYNVLDTILIDVESLIPTNCATFEELQALLILAGQTAESLFTAPPNSAIADKAMAEEREHFVAYVQQLTVATVQSVTSLPYRRTLLLPEEERFRREMERHWGVGKGYWHPLIARDIPAGILAFQAAWFIYAVPIEQLRDILVGRGITRLWELRESSAGFEIAIGLFVPTYTGGEGYWTSPGFDWLIYASHESSVTVAGEWLLAEIKAIWPDWERYLYTTYDYERPPVP